MNLNIFRITNNKIGFNKYKMVIRFYDNLEKSSWRDDTFYFNEADCYEWEVNRIPKHQLMELVSKDEIDPGEYAWMEGIEISSEYQGRQIEKIASYGSKEAYEASLESNRDAYLLELDYQVSMLSLGLN